jgi:hypothetical protein
LITNAKLEWFDLENSLLKFNDIFTMFVKAYKKSAYAGFKNYEIMLWLDSVIIKTFYSPSVPMPN